MKEATIVQQYILTAVIRIDVDDDWTDTEIVESFRDFPINVKVEQMLDTSSPLNEGIHSASIDYIELETAEWDKAYRVLDKGRIINAVA